MGGRNRGSESAEPQIARKDISDSETQMPEVQKVTLLSSQKKRAKKKIKIYIFPRGGGGLLMRSQHYMMYIKCV